LASPNPPDAAPEISGIQKARWVGIIMEEAGGTWLRHPKSKKAWIKNPRH
jgi:hypothetical protein